MGRQPHPSALTGLHGTPRSLLCILQQWVDFGDRDGSFGLGELNGRDLQEVRTEDRTAKGKQPEGREGLGCDDFRAKEAR